MKVALAGAGDVGFYFIEELSKAKHEFILLTRAAKSLPNGLQAKQVKTDYTVDDLLSKIEGFDVVISTISADNDVYLSVHSALLEACRRSKSCKRFIPSEWTVNVQDFPDQPTYLIGSRSPFRKALQEQNEVEYTILSCYWFMDYLLPFSRRYLKDLGRGWVTNNEEKLFDMYGDGLTSVSLTSVRDVARATLALLKQPQGTWEQHTHFAAQTMRYRELFELLKKRDSSWKERPVSLTEIVESIGGKNPQFPEVDYLMILGYTRANTIREENALSLGRGPLAGVHARSVQSLLDEADKDPHNIL